MAEKRRETKGKGERERYTQLNTEFQKTEEIRKTSQVKSVNKQMKAMQWERLEISLRKLELPTEYFMHNKRKKKWQEPERSKRD